MAFVDVKLLAVAVPANNVPVVVNPDTWAFPTTSKNSLGIDVPIPTRPLELMFTTKLSWSTWIPFLMLNVFLKLYT